MAIGGTKKTSLTRENVLKRITEYDIFRFYMMGRKWKVNETTLSPFRDESNPSFLISNRSGTLYFVDFADTAKRGDCFEFVQQLYNCNLDGALRTIDKDFGLGFVGTATEEYKRITAEYTQPEELGKRYSLIQVQTRKHTHEELTYWNQYHQSLDDLRAEDVYSISKLYLNRQLFPLKETELRFGYFYDGHWKIYRPFEDPKRKWMPNNVPITAMDGKSNIVDADFSFVNKSKKDYMVVKKLIKTSCAVQNEGIACFSPENVEFLKENSKRQILSFDSDVTGVKNSQQITQLFGFEYCNVPRTYLSDGIKDWALLSKDYGMNTVERIFKKKGLL